MANDTVFEYILHFFVNHLNKVIIIVFFQLQRQLSDKNQVTLENLNLNSAGQYRCEISAEAPLFNTVAQSKKLNVIGKEVFCINKFLRSTICDIPLTL